MARTVPVTATKAATQLITGALWNAGPKALGDFMLAPPVFRGRQSSATQSMTTATWFAMNLNAEDIDSDNGHSTVTNNSRYVCQVPGWYWVEGYVAVNSGGSGRFGASIAKNGTQIVGSMQTALVVADLQSLSAGCFVQLAVGDYVETWGWQGSGGTISTFDGGDLCPCMNVFWVHS